MQARKAIDVHAASSRWDSSGIAYEFKFDITETNAVGASADLLRPFTNGKLLFGIGASEERQREGTRNFQIVETFAELRREDCSVEALEKDWRYPITGVVGMDEIVSTFAKLAKMNLLEKGGGNAASFTDILEFTTTIKASVNPSIELNAVPGHLRLTEAKASLSGERKDVHRLTVALSIPDPAAGPGRERARRDVGGGTAKQRALRGLDRQLYRDTQERILEELKRR